MTAGNDKKTFDVDMVVLTVGFSQTQHLKGKIELFHNGAFLVDKNKNFNSRCIRCW